MAQSQNHPKISKLVLIAPLGQKGKMHESMSIEIDCFCRLERVKLSKWNSFRSVINEIQATQNWSEIYSPKFSTMCALAGKILIKAPNVLRGIFWNLKTYNLVEINNCRTHKLQLTNSSQTWYSNSAARIGFPWSREVFVNSLNLIRDPHLQLLVFSYIEKKKTSKKDYFTESREVVLNKLQEKEYIAIGQLQKNKGFKAINTWSGSKLLMIEESEILHGTVLLSNGSYVSQDNSIAPQKFLGRMTPCSIWSDSRLKSHKTNYISPKAENELKTLESGLFINASLSFYHFISESIRPLAQAIENEIPIPNIIIRNDLPPQFYDLIRILSPESTQILLDKGERLRVKKLIAGVVEDRLSLSDEVFSNYSLEKLLETDEWKLWSWIRSHSRPIFLPSETLYLTRNRYESRGIQNSVALEDSLRKNQVAILNTAQENFSSQLSHFKNSKLVCSTSGASLVNLIFMPPGSTLIELTYPFGHSWKFLAELCGIRHEIFPVTSYKPKRLSTALDTYVVNEEKLNLRITELNKVF
jgi:hypothetical protein